MVHKYSRELRYFKKCVHFTLLNVWGVGQILQFNKATFSTQDHKS